MTTTFKFDDVVRVGTGIVLALLDAALTLIENVRMFRLTASEILCTLHPNRLGQDVQNKISSFYRISVRDDSVMYITYIVA